MWWSTIMHEPSTKSTLQIHILQQIWKDVSKEIAVSPPPPSQKWWNIVGSQKSFSCSACVETEGGHSEHVLELPGSH